ncbi:MAG: thermonuclease family protein [Chromatiales bacterium]|jgi:endonuclease YncB( thermonuclease family)
MNLKQKAPQCGAFLLLWLVCTMAGVASASCDPFTGGEELEVAHVYDGDTLKLADGRNIRLIGINTPEMGRDGNIDEAGAQQALDRLESLVLASDQRVHLMVGEQQTDRYGRQLAHLYGRGGNNITELLLREGLGYVIAFPPNLRNLACYEAAESMARKARRGLWRSESVPLDVQQLSTQEDGFRLIRGRVGRIGKSRRSLWLNLEQGPALRIDLRDWQAFPDLEPDALAGRRLEVRGWLYHRKGQQRMQVRHPSAIQWLD